jgi:hypothetical protein
VSTSRDYRDLIHGNAAFSGAFSAVLADTLGAFALAAPRSRPQRHDAARLRALWRRTLAARHALTPDSLRM